MRPRRSISCLACAVALVALAPAAAAESPHLERARAQRAALEYAEARRSLEQALAAGSSDAAELAAIYRLAAEIEAGLDRPAVATEHFKHLLALQPAATLPPGTSPKVVAPFEAARAFFSGRAPLRVRVAVERGTAPAVAVVVEADPLGMVTGARIEYAAGDGAPVVAHAAATATPMRFALPPAPVLRFSVAVVDRHGNTLVTHGTLAAPIEIVAGAAPLAPPEGRVDGGRPLRARWQLWGSVAVGAGAAGAAFGWRMRAAERSLADLNAMSEGRDFSREAAPIERRGRRYALAANVGLAVAGASAVAAGVLWARERRGARRELTVAPAAGGVTAIIRVQY